MFAILYCSALLIIITLFKQLPPLESLADNKHTNLELRVPHSFSELREARATLEIYRRAHSQKVTILLAAAYLFLQTFIMPGSLAINILCGSLYSTPTAFTFVIVMSTIGASSNFLLVRWLLRDIIMGLFPHRIQSFQTELKRHQAHLLNYMLFIRVTPIAPSWFVNLASPVVGVPFTVFVTATVVGHVPINFITVQAGATLQSMQSMQDLYSVRNVLFMMSVGVAALLPVLWKRWVAKGKASMAAGGGTGQRQQRTKLVPVIERGRASYVRS